VYQRSETNKGGLSCHGLVGMVSSELGFHRELSSSDLNQFGVIRRGHKGPKPGLWSPFIFLFHFIKPTPLLLLLPSVILLPASKKLPKTRHNLGVRNLCTYTDNTQMDE